MMFIFYKDNEVYGHKELWVLLASVKRKDLLRTLDHLEARQSKHNGEN